MAPPIQASVSAKVIAPEMSSDQTVTGSLSLATRSQFGIDLGAERSIGALRTHWIKLTEKFDAITKGYEPLISVSDAQGGVMLHLVVGPFSNAAEAAEICAKLRASGLSACTPVLYDGQRLALR
jgi:hypothetical protein